MITFWAKLEQEQCSRIRQNIRIDVDQLCRDVTQVIIIKEQIKVT